MSQRGGDPSIRGVAQRHHHNRHRLPTTIASYSYPYEYNSASEHLQSNSEPLTMPNIPDREDMSIDSEDPPIQPVDQAMEDLEGHEQGKEFVLFPS